ncbi:MAG TPA: HEAT repeat domain-containing protein [Planctomycetota bacterium]|nr:HEAT repeat domain-containing protein [Planctomycetota bacterium]
MGKASLAVVAIVLGAGLPVTAMGQADDKAAVEEAIKRFSKGFSNPSPGARATAVLELSKTLHDKTLNRILPLIVSDVSEVRVAAAKSLAEFADWKKIVTPSLTGALKPNEKDLKVVQEIYATLGKLQDPVAISTVHGNFREPDVRVAKFAIGCAGAMRQKESMDALLELQKDVQKWLKNKQAGPYRDEKGQQGDDNAIRTRMEDVQKTIIKAYQDITKEKWATANEWEIWWGKKKATFEIPK